MATLITLKEYSIQYNIEPEFLLELEESGIIFFQEEGEEKYILEEQLSELERYIRFYYDLNINIEGIDAIRHLLAKVAEMEREIKMLRGQLHLHQ
ncbi:chaperone modulator CbpM [Pedobacter sp. SAFR-022]|uniref:chaperone modulator CbpM n=1 Tax=Pedobacter sp. SAFR-022 TaxID=3436861 RepID=UPI003F7DE2B1